MLKIKANKYNGSYRFNYGKSKLKEYKIFLKLALGIIKEKFKHKLYKNINLIY